MLLSNNQKQVLHLLLENSRLTDMAIASQVGISSQAVGQIRKELEEELIEGYSVRLKSELLGVKAFSIMKIVLPAHSEDLEKKITNLDNTITFIRTMQGEDTYFAIFGFSSCEELEAFINKRSEGELKNIRNKIIIKEVLPFTQNNVLKTSAKDLLRSKITLEN